MDFPSKVYFYPFSHEVEEEIRKYGNAVTGLEWKKTSYLFAVDFLVFGFLLCLIASGFFFQTSEFNAFFLIPLAISLLGFAILSPRLFRASLEIFGGDVRHLVLRTDVERVHDPLLKIGHEINQLKELLEPIVKEWNDYMDCLQQGYDRDTEMEALWPVLCKLRALIKEMVEELNVLIKMRLKEKSNQEIFVDLHEVIQRLEALQVQISAVKETLKEMDGLKVPQGAAVHSVRIDEAVASLTGQLSEAERAHGTIQSLRARNAHRRLAQ